MTILSFRRNIILEHVSNALCFDRKSQQLLFRTRLQARVADLGANGQCNVSNTLGSSVLPADVVALPALHSL